MSPLNSKKTTALFTPVSFLHHFHEKTSVYFTNSIAFFLLIPILTQRQIKYCTGKTEYVQLWMNVLFGAYLQGLSFHDTKN